MPAAFREAEFDMTAHGVEEMTEDGLDLLDLETAISNGWIYRIEKDDPREHGIPYMGPPQMVIRQ